jgi:hypothetical protein
MRSYGFLGIGTLFLFVEVVACGGDESSLFEPGSPSAGGTGGDASITPTAGAGGTPGCSGSTPTMCGSDCVNTLNNQLHCGACGQTCSAGLSCDNGACISKMCKVDPDCEDGFGCTIDSCVQGKCAHAPGPNIGSTQCPSGQFCVVGKGCVLSKACQQDANCADDDPCTTGEKCDPAIAICTWVPLDKDSDGHAPVVCGGDDCDDSNASVYAGAPELCDALDNNCDGTPDNGATCASAFASCQAGACVCAPQYACGQECADKNTSQAHCGTCFHACPAGSACANGQCACPSGTPCAQGCVDLNSNKDNCGACEHACAYSSTCQGGNCKCPGAQLLCGGQCVDGSANPYNCGACGHACSNTEQCSQGKCVCVGKVCSNVCVDTSTDPANCGQCGNPCTTGTWCSGGTCGGIGGSSGAAGSGAYMGLLPAPAIKCGPGQFVLFGTCFP